jgi:hypothetical protein
MVDEGYARYERRSSVGWTLAVMRRGSKTSAGRPARSKNDKGASLLRPLLSDLGKVAVVLWVAGTLASIGAGVNRSVFNKPIRTKSGSCWVVTKQVDYVSRFHMRLFSALVSRELCPDGQTRCFAHPYIHHSLITTSLLGWRYEDIKERFLGSETCAFTLEFRQCPAVPSLPCVNQWVGTAAIANGRKFMTKRNGRWYQVNLKPSLIP